ncbi:RNA helicase [Aphelenchoides besseyi]|nr:RNA helicase [Aphelenchoides besseyi]
METNSARLCKITTEPRKSKMNMEIYIKSTQLPSSSPIQSRDSSIRIDLDWIASSPASSTVGALNSILVLTLSDLNDHQPISTGSRSATLQKSHCLRSMRVAVLETIRVSKCHRTLKSRTKPNNLDSLFFARCAAVNEMGWEKPTTVQGAMIPQLLQGSNMCARARTGTGKTGAFLLPLIQRVLLQRDFVDNFYLVSWT